MDKTGRPSLSGTGTLATCVSSKHTTCPPPATIFLSYAASEREFALRLATALKSEGVSIWMDYLDGIRPGQEWPRRIEEAVDGCAAMIVVLSPTYVARRYTRRELARADSRQIPIFPVLLQDIPDSQWPVELQRIQYVDFRNASDFGSCAAALIDQVKALNPGEVGERPDEESRYLLGLLVELEKSIGVRTFVSPSSRLEEDLSANQETRLPPRAPENWGLEPEFALIDDTTRRTPRERVSTGSFQDVIAAMSDRPRFVLLGDPGAGKTTALKRFAAECARSRVAGLSAPTPVMASLAAWRDRETFRAFLRRIWPFSGEPERALATGDYLLCLDGVNEMGEGAPERAAELRRWLNGLESSARVIVTCRLRDYDESDSKLTLDVPRVIIEPLDEERISLFIERYLGTKADAFLSRIRDFDRSVWNPARRLAAMTTNPFLLTGLLAVYEATGKVTASFGGLFEKLSRVLWERERLRVTPGWVPYGDLERRLAALALTMIETRMPTETSIAFAVEHGLDRPMIRAAQSANLLREAGPDGMAFHHQLIQEYFAAVALSRCNPNDILTTRALFPPIASDQMNVIECAADLAADSGPIYVATRVSQDPLRAIELLLNALTGAGDNKPAAVRLPSNGRWSFPATAVELAMTDFLWTAVAHFALKHVEAESKSARSAAEEARKLWSERRQMAIGIDRAEEHISSVNNEIGRMVELLEMLAERIPSAALAKSKERAREILNDTPTDW